VVVLAAGASLVAYVLLPAQVLDLAWAQPSYAGEVFPWVELLTREWFDARDALEGDAGVERHTAAAVRFLLLLLVLFTAYGLTLRAVAGRRSTALEAAVFGIGALFLALQTTGRAMLSDDLFAYVVYGRIFALFGGNPYSPVLELDPGDPYLQLWKVNDAASWYGPLWTLMSGGLAWLGDERIGLTVLLFRGTAVAACLATAALIWGCLRRAAPHRAAQGLVFFLWNPLVVLETGLSGHNDAVMLAFLLLGIWLHLHGRRALAVAALSLSVLVKFVTVLILPLYLLVVLRHLPTWRGRLRYLLVSGAGAVLTVALLFGLARSGPQVLAAGSAGAGVRYYTNNVHELLFRGLRVWLGEDVESAAVPVYFRGWWVATHASAALRASPEPSGEVLERVAPGAALFVVAPQATDWARVYDPNSGRTGYLHESALVVTERPATAEGDPVLARLEAGSESSPSVLQANTWLRLVTWGAFGAVSLLAAWRTADLRGFLVWSTVVMLALYWLVGGYIWPWYPIWSLALAALVPTSLPARLAAVLSATVLSLYVTGGYQGTAHEWIYTYRSLPAFVLPLVLFLLSLGVGRLGRA